MKRLKMQQFENFQQVLLNRTIEQVLQRNDQNTKVWIDYKKEHKKVIKALEILPSKLTENCMVPMGKRAFMKGKLTHTNEILACIGNGYFSKYSALQAIALCNRRVKMAEDALEKLEGERNLFEARQLLPSQFDAFGNEEKLEYEEICDEDKLIEWKVEHRKRVAEYHKKLADLKRRQETKSAGTNIKTEKDIFERLDELEMEEEIMEEYDRLQEEGRQSFMIDLNESDREYESDEEDMEASNKEIAAEIKKLEAIRAQRLNSNDTMNEIFEHSTMKVQQKALYDELKENIKADKNFDIFENDNRKKISEYKSDEKLEPKSFNESTTEISESLSETEITTVADYIKIQRRVSFAELKGNEKETTIKDQSSYSNELEGNIVIIKFSHSTVIPDISENTADTIESPQDIYRLFVKPKSILKRSLNDVINYQKIDCCYEFDEEMEQEEERPTSDSVYQAIVKDVHVKEALASRSEIEETITVSRPISRFKIERSKKK